MKGGSILHLSKLNFNIVKMGLKMASNPPLQIHEIHFFNCLSFIHILLQLVKPFAKREMKELVSCYELVIIGLLC
jgi:hypothetical protein